MPGTLHSLGYLLRAQGSVLLKNLLAGLGGAQHVRGCHASKQENLRLDPQNPCKCLVGQTAGTETRSPRSKRTSKTSHIHFRLDQETLPQRIKLKSNQGKFLLSTSTYASVHANMHTHTTQTHRKTRRKAY